MNKSNKNYPNINYKNVKDFISKLDNSYNFYISLLHNRNTDSDNLNLNHSFCVAKFANDIFNSLPDKNNELQRIIIISALLHDIKKFSAKTKDEKKYHHKLDDTFIISILQQSDMTYLNYLKEIIFFHKGKKNKAALEENPDLLLVAQIVHDADKISKLYKYRVCNENLNNISKKLELDSSLHLFNKHRLYMLETTEKPKLRLFPYEIF